MKKINKKRFLTCIFLTPSGLPITLGFCVLILFLSVPAFVTADAKRSEKVTVRIKSEISVDCEPVKRSDSPTYYFDCKKD